MTPSPHPSRRDILKGVAAALLAGPFLRSRGLGAEAPAAPGGNPAPRLRLGVASISLRNLPVDAAVSVLQQLAIGDVSIFRTHAAFEKGEAAACRATADAFRAGGINPWTTSVVYLKNDEATARRAFENVRAAGMSMMTCSPAPDALPLLDRLLQEYDIKLAIHNHGPEDKDYPSPYEIMQLVAGHDARIGVCNDVGHTMRAGHDPAQSIRDCAPRLFDVHLKDSVAAVGAKDVPVNVGHGHLDIRGILAALIDVKYAGAVAFEYEVEEGDPAVGLAESIGYVRGLLAAM